MSRLAIRLLLAVAVFTWVASSLWLATSPRITVWSRDELLDEIGNGNVDAVLETGDQHGDIVIRTTAGDDVVYRPPATIAGGLGRSDAVVAAIRDAGHGDLLAAGQTDPVLASYARSVAAIELPDATVPMLAWWISLIGGLSVAMYVLAERTGVRFSVPIGQPFGVGTDPSPRPDSSILR
ncbi:MAG TPA: hypothetical protein VFR93_11255 [Candidatus Limnocylindrales bacterium]|nr:hypothetical protein [Candidatus Limnocylindrales bacterium]